MIDEVIRTRLLEAVGNLYDALLMPADERTAASIDLPALRRAVRNVLRPAAPSAPPVAPAAPDALDDPATLAAVHNQDDPVEWLRAKLPPTDADALAKVVRLAGENAEAARADHEAATREAVRMSHAAAAAETALLAVAAGERLDADPKASLAKPLNDARARVKAMDIVRKKVDRARPGQARRAIRCRQSRVTARPACCRWPTTAAPCCRWVALRCWPARVALRKPRSPCRWRWAWRRNGCRSAICTAACSPVPAAPCCLPAMRTGPR